jgi:hypothetical protein
MLVMFKDKEYDSKMDIIPEAEVLSDLKQL